MKLKKIEEALQAADKAIELDPDNEEVLNAKGYALASLEQHNEAIRYYNRAIELKPDYAEAYYYKGRSLCELYSYEAAVICFSKARAINPSFKLAMIHQNSTVNYLKGRTLQAKTKDLIKRISRTKFIGQ